MKSHSDKEPKILLFDIETSPNLAYIWGKYEQDAIAFEREWIILSFSAKWLNGKQITKGLIDYPIYKKNKEDDSALVKDLWNLFNEADILIAHNGNKFDIKKCNARFSYHKLSPPAPYKTVDTLKIARSEFAFNSNKLGDLGQYLKLGAKIETGGFLLWKKCIAGNVRAWATMKRYNVQDVLLLEKVYYRFLPWIKNHPSFSTFLSERVCPKCRSTRLKSEGLRRNFAGEYRRLHCLDCGGWAKEAINNKKKVSSI